MVWKNEQVSERETEEIIRLARECLEIEGDFVEMGCYKGDTSLILAEVIRGCEGKRLWIYDSFEGLPEKSKEDESVMGGNFQKGALTVIKREVKERFLRAGLPVPVIKKAWFRDLEPQDLPERIAFAFIDGDFYESIRDALKLVMPRMANGGVVVVHDYDNPALPGVRKAVEELVGNGLVKVFSSMAVIHY